MRLSSAVRCLAIAGAILLSGCSSSNPDLYTIAPIPGASVAGSPRVIVLREIGLARYLQRLSIVRSSENYRLDVMANDWWGEPLQAMLSRVLVDELNQRLPGSTVYGENGAVTSPADATLEVNFERLDEDVAGSLVLVALASVTFKGHPGTVTRSFRLVVRPAGTDVAAEVAAASKAVGQLSDGLAAMVRGR